MIDAITEPEPRTADQEQASWIQVALSLIGRIFRVNKIEAPYIEATIAEDIFLPLVPPKKSRLAEWTAAIQSFEGWFPGSVSYRNKNPGNLKYTGQRKAIGRDAQNHAIFASYKDGYDAG
jgi:hypothetical protein